MKRPTIGARHLFVGRFWIRFAFVATTVAVAAWTNSVQDDKGHVKPGDPPPGKAKSVFETAIERPTGNNGYEEYARAADVMREKKVRAASLACLTPPEGVSPLAARRAFVAAGRQALGLVRAGNKKPISDPRAKLRPMTLFPEFAEFRLIARLFAAESRVRLADGDAAGAVQSLTDCLTFSSRIGGYIIIGSLIGQVVVRTALTEAEAQLGFYSQPEALSLAKAADDFLRQPIALKAAFEKEAELYRSALDELSDDIAGTLADWMPGDSENQKWVVDSRNLTAAERKAVLAQAEQTLKERWAAIVTRLDGPEKGWSAESEPESAPTDLAEFIANMLIPVTDNVFSAAAVTRTQLRLLRLHGAIISFQWEHRRLPKDLDEIGNDEIVADPMTGGRFHYEVVGESGYRLWSAGWSKTGRIELKYTKPVGSLDDPKLP